MLNKCLRQNQRIYKAVFSSKYGATNVRYNIPPEEAIQLDLSYHSQLFSRTNSSLSYLSKGEFWRLIVPNYVIEQFAEHLDQHLDTVKSSLWSVLLSKSALIQQQDNTFVTIFGPLQPVTISDKMITDNIPI